MIELGKIQKLEIVKIATVGAYLNSKEDKAPENVLLPKKQVPEEAAIGDEIEVFIYRDSEDRLISTTTVPKITLGDFKLLKVVDVNAIGAFLNWGLEKDLFIPFKEQTEKLHKNDPCFVTLYIDKSNRLCATMKVYDRLSCESHYKVDNKVKGIVYSIKKDLGAFIAVDSHYQGLVPAHELFSDLTYGDIIEARVTKVREDGKLDLSMRDKSYTQMDVDADAIYEKLVRAGGFLPYNDETPPSKVKSEFGMSKSAFKRALGRLFKAHKICFLKDGIQKLQ